MNTGKFDINAILNDGYSYSSQFLSQGKLADYIPKLAQCDPNKLGIALTTLEGQVYTIGECQHYFTIQSISKIILLCTATEDVGYDEVFRKVGTEPTGDPFNSIIRLENRSKIPLNPMINAGALSVTSSITGSSPKERLDKVLNLSKKLLDNPQLTYDEDVYISESLTGDRNRALIYMLKSNGIISGNVEEHLEIYFKTCSILANCKELSYMSAVLANNGVCPKTKETIISNHTARLIRSLMVTCGLYDGSGKYAVNVGIPSKSGVGGGIIGAVPNKLGISVYSPKLDDCGNSYCGIKAMEFISEKMELNIL